MSEWLLSRRDRLIVAWHEAPGSDAERPLSRRDGRSHCQSRREGKRCWPWPDYFLGISHAKTCFCDVSIAKPRSVQSSRWDEAIFPVTPGTSCLATIMLSLRDKIHSPAEAFLKLALMLG